MCARAAENVVTLSLNKYASNCVERVLQHADAEIMSVLTSRIFKQGNLERMMADNYAKCALVLSTTCSFASSFFHSISRRSARISDDKEQDSPLNIAFFLHWCSYAVQTLIMSVSEQDHIDELNHRITAAKDQLRQTVQGKRILKRLAALTSGRQVILGS